MVRSRVRNKCGHFSVCRVVKTTEKSWKSSLKSLLGQYRRYSVSHLLDSQHACSKTSIPTPGSMPFLCHGLLGVDELL